MHSTVAVPTFLHAAEKNRRPDLLDLKCSLLPFGMIGSDLLIDLRVFGASWRWFSVRIFRRTSR